MKTWPGSFLTSLLGGLPARFSSASGRGKFIHVTNHRRATTYLLRSDWSISHPPNPLNHSMLTTSFPYGDGRGKNIMIPVKKKKVWAAKRAKTAIIDVNIEYADNSL